MTDFCVVFVTCPAGPDAENLAARLVEEKLAACVNVVSGVRSVYAWEGKLERSSEALLVIKSRRALFGELERFVRAHHPYTCPEIVSLPLVEGAAPYLDWIRANTRA
jgi:periplasmic divalent cation tolerance protein